MARRNSKDVRQSSMTQRQLNRLLSKKQKSDRRNDAKDWTDKLIERPKEVSNDGRTE